MKENQDETVRGMLRKETVFAVVGVSENPDKYGHKVYFDLKGAGFEVLPINPNAEFIGENRCYSSISALPKKPDVLVMVVPPNVAMQVLKQAIQEGIRTVWFQPGSESEEAIKYCKQNNIESIHNMCIMVQRQQQ